MGLLLWGIMPQRYQNGIKKTPQIEAWGVFIYGGSNVDQWN
jgi:hypothetical protein